MTNQSMFLYINVIEQCEAVEIFLSHTLPISQSYITNIKFDIARANIPNQDAEINLLPWLYDWASII